MHRGETSRTLWQQCACCEQFLIIGPERRVRDRAAAGAALDGSGVCLGISGRVRSTSRGGRRPRACALARCSPAARSGCPRCSRQWTTGWGCSVRGRLWPFGRTLSRPLMATPHREAGTSLRGRASCFRGAGGARPGGGALDPSGGHRPGARQAAHAGQLLHRRLVPGSDFRLVDPDAGDELVTRLWPDPRADGRIQIIVSESGLRRLLIMPGSSADRRCRTGSPTSRCRHPRVRPRHRRGPPARLRPPSGAWTKVSFASKGLGAASIPSAVVGSPA